MDNNANKALPQLNNRNSRALNQPNFVKDYKLRRNNEVDPQVAINLDVHQGKRSLQNSLRWLSLNRHFSRGSPPEGHLNYLFVQRFRGLHE